MAPQAAASSSSGGRNIAYLGPPGTYGEQAATRFAKRLGGDLSLVPCPTIKSIYAHPAPFLVLPLENTLHGVVLDTVDALLTPLSPAYVPPATHPHPRIIADTALRIAHHLVAPRGSTLADITEVRSHEQALGQSAAWLDAHVPGAKRVSWPSTAGAMRSVLDAAERGAGKGLAAICSRAAWEAERDKLELLCAGTQGVKHNYTRFVLVAREAADLESLKPEDRDRAAATERLFFACASAEMVGKLARHPALALVSVHQRPAPAGAGVPSRPDEPAPLGPWYLPRWTLVEAARVPGHGSPTVEGVPALGRAWSVPPREDGEADGREEETGVPEDELGNDDKQEQEFLGSGAV